MKKDDTVINVYWAPYIPYNSGLHNDWSMLYPEPTNLYSDLSKLKTVNPDSKKSFFVCPAIKNTFKNTYVFKNVIKSEYNYDIDRVPVFIPESKTHLGASTKRLPAISTGPTVEMSLSYIFFADKDLETMFLPPMFHSPKYTRYGTVFPGEYNIGSWFRPYNFEIQLWENSGKLVLEEDEPIFYTKFLTDKTIKMNRFVFNEKLFSYSEHCTSSPSYLKANLPLIDRYNRFKESKMNYSILKEIKENLILDEGDGKN
jgi:hypothetical protein